LDLTRLRQATRSDHERVEGAIPLMQPDLKPDFYCAVLQRLLGVVQAWEQIAEVGLPKELLFLLQERRRSPLLRQDLSTFGSSMSVIPQPVLPRFASTAEWLGAMYVMEGSRLGGQLIAKHVRKTLSLESDQGVLFFTGFGSATRASWEDFLKTMDSEVPQEDTDKAIHGAKQMFHLFGEWMRGVPRAS
jgi:heme oxygenase (biliverdin-IX-beta and delta-forming)